MSAGHLQEGLAVTRRAAAIEPAAFGSEYLAGNLERAGAQAEALAEYRECQRSRPLQLFLSAPAPAGSWQRAADAVRRLDTVVQPKDVQPK